MRSLTRWTLIFALLILPLAACTGGTGSNEGNGESHTDEGYADAMSREHSGETGEASGAADGEPAREVASRGVVYATVDGQEIRGWLARPAGVENAPGLIVIHEWWGLNENVRKMAEKLAGEGYAALAVDLYAGQAADSPEKARELVQSVDETNAQENLRQAYSYLTEQAGAGDVGTIGWCFGGGWSLQTALLMPETVDATVIYYGRLVTDKERLEPLTMPILGLFGAEDEGIPVSSVREFEQALEELGKDVEIHVYDGADHAFANPSGSRYDPEAAEKAWKETTDFLAAHLKG